MVREREDGDEGGGWGGRPAVVWEVIDLAEAARVAGCAVRVFLAHCARRAADGRVLKQGMYPAWKGSGYVLAGTDARGKKIWDFRPVFYRHQVEAAVAELARRGGDGRKHEGSKSKKTHERES